MKILEGKGLLFLWVKPISKTQVVYDPSMEALKNSPVFFFSVELSLR